MSITGTLRNFRMNNETTISSNRRHSQLQLFLSLVLVCVSANSLQAQKAYTWEEIRDRFSAVNPTLKANELSIEESRAAEITAYLRPNPDFSLTADGVQINRNQGVWTPFSGVVETPGVSYLHDANTNVNCGGIKRRRILPLRNQPIRISNAICFSICATRLCKPCKQRLSTNRWQFEYWDHELDINRKRLAPAIWRKSI